MRIQNSLFTSLTFCSALFSFSVFASGTISPAFDCQKAQGQVELLICKDDQLAKLDVQLSKTYRKAINQIGNDELANFKAFQRGWIKGRNDCWKATDIKQCVQSSYETRLTELQIAAAEFEVPEPIQYECGLKANDTLTKITAYFYNDTTLPAAMLTITPTSNYIKATNLALLTRTASGAKYQGQNFSFWTHQGEAIFSQFEQADLSCKIH
ncbi:lysozyme inhibitor LprI family protein [Shewanella sp. KT0246]|uniref:lysozyme inhibitor LprI family protein n=1 Tax=Shewanella sp. KT0246 TaxID=2815912 RepID=UPI001BC77A82|nr:lysozyme inhibitor LprI family protein [Shewanella sp. KT0246]GIU48934.1 hypothetical protein TUM4249_05440 [Shewanella sp. KT0246]